MSHLPPSERSAYRVFRSLASRWSDNDMYGHMNNVVHYALFDTAINGWLVERGLLDPLNGPVICLVAETGCRYHGEMGFPDRIDAGLAVEHLGTSSIVYRIGLFRNDEAHASAEGRFVHVCVDHKSRKPVPLPQDWRHALTEMIA